MSGCRENHGYVCGRPSFRVALVSFDSSHGVACRCMLALWLAITVLEVVSLNISAGAVLFCFVILCCRWISLVCTPLADINVEQAPWTITLQVGSWCWSTGAAFWAISGQIAGVIRSLSCDHEAQPWFYLYHISITQIFVNEQQTFAAHNPVSLRHADPSKAVLHLELAWRGLVITTGVCVYCCLSEIIMSLYRGTGGALTTVC